MLPASNAGHQSGSSQRRPFESAFQPGWSPHQAIVLSSKQPRRHRSGPNAGGWRAQNPRTAQAAHTAQGRIYTDIVVRMLRRARGWKGGTNCRNTAVRRPRARVDSILRRLQLQHSGGGAHTAARGAAAAAGAPACAASSGFAVWCSAGVSLAARRAGAGPGRGSTVKAVSASPRDGTGASRSAAQPRQRRRQVTTAATRKEKHLPVALHTATANTSSVRCTRRRSRCNGRSGTLSGQRWWRGGRGGGSGVTNAPHHGGGSSCGGGPWC